MPKHEQTISLQQLDNETALAIGYQALKNLNWPIKFAGENTLLGYTPQKWNSWALQILLTVQDGNLTVSSEMVNNESFDMAGKNKKAVANFISAFEAAKNADEATLEKNKAAIIDLKSLTIKAAEEEQQKAAEVDKAMHLSGSNLYVTYGIMAINILIFVLMAINGAGVFEANDLVHIKWGSNYTPLTLSGDWWRLITNTFIHFGIIHLLMNMYCLYTVGVYLEPMLGKLRYIVAYLCTGVLASLTSLWWHSEGVNSAGASGAIFGMYGLFLALLTTNLIPKHVRQGLLSSIAIFIAYNLFYGMKGGVDNAAHIGGLISGFIIGYVYVFGIKKETPEQKIKWLAPAVVIITILVTVGYLQQHKIDGTDRNAELQAVEESSYKDYAKFNDNLLEFDKINQEEEDLLNDSLSNEELKERIDIKGLPKWKEAERLLNATKNYDISARAHQKAEKILTYIELRKEEFGILTKMIEANSTDELMPQLKETKTKAAAIFKEAIGL